MIPQNIIWIQTSFIGDIVLTTGAIDLVSKTWPGTKQILITTHLGQTLLAHDPRLAEVHSLQKSGLQFWRNAWALRKHFRKHLKLGTKDTMILQPHRSARSSMLARILGFDVVTYNETSLGSCAKYKVDRVAVFHEAVRIALLLEPLGLSREKILTSRPLLPKAAKVQSLEVQGLWNQVDRSRKIIGIAPGSRWGTKRWPSKSYAELAQKLLQNQNVSIIILGSKDEKPLADQIEKSLRSLKGSSQQFFNLAGLTPLGDLAAIIAQLDLVITNDSSPIHFASAFNTPTVAIFGSTTPSLGFGPLSSKSKVMGIDLNCRPCSDHGPEKCPLGHFQCMLNLPIDQVYRASLDLLH